MHLLLSVLQTIFLIKYLYVKSQSIASTSDTTFWWMLQMQRKWVIFEPARTHHLGFKVQNFKNPIFTFGFFSLKTIFNSCKLQRLLQVAEFLFRYSFTHTNIVFLYRHLPTENVIFMTFVTRWSVSVVIDFPFLEAGFSNIPPTFLISFEVQTRTLKYSEHYTRDHLAVNKVRTWICPEYDAVFNLPCIAFCKLAKSCTFPFTSFLS